MNVLGAVNSVTAVIPHMVQRGSGHLVAISSLAAYRGLPKSAAYCAARPESQLCLRALRIDLIKTGVDVTIIHPGFIKTPLTAGRMRMPFLMELDDAVQKMIRAIEKRRKKLFVSLAAGFDCPCLHAASNSSVRLDRVA